jgi:hypothetical protein
MLMTEIQATAPRPDFGNAARRSIIRAAGGDAATT